MELRLPPSPFFVLALLAGAAPAQSLQANLTALDDIHARWVTWPAGWLGAIQTHLAGPLGAANVQVGYISQGNVACYTCNLSPAGNGAGSGYVFDATTFVAGTVTGVRFETHADLRLVLTGPTDLVASIGLSMGNGGDFASASCFRIDLGDDGTFEIDSGCTCASAQKHRLWTWDFAAGSLAIRIRTDQQSGGGAQPHSLRLAVQPWVAEASPVAPDCGGVASVATPGDFFRESSNYQLAPDVPAQPQDLTVLRAVGLGQFNVLIVAMQPVTVPLPLPSPFPSGCNVLANVLLTAVLAPSSVTTTVPPGTPWEWRLRVPRLPAGLTFFAQHASIETSAPWFGASNVIRIDT